MAKTLPITIDGSPTQARAGSMLLTVLRAEGIPVPTLCHHPSLEPSGACRLCVVEITHADWNGWSGLVTSCLYPVEPGLQVLTRSPRVIAARRSLLELYLARCPDSQELRALARSEGMDRTSFPVREGADLCILCGLCTRVCNDLGPSAIAPLGRGTDKEVGPRPDKVGEDCTACGACALICPTGEITMTQDEKNFSIWNREFPIAHCRVEPEKCRGCGICDEVCPHAVPRVAAFQTGAFVSKIAPSACTGCGICAGACPAGAIVQEAPYTDLLPKKGDLRGETICFACSRSALREEEGVRRIEVPCIGRVPTETMLEALARGADGILLLCRDQATCPSGVGGALGEQRARVAGELAASAGLGEGRIVAIKPEPGPEGPARALRAFKESLAANPLQETFGPPEGPNRGLDHALNLLQWLKDHSELTPSLPASLAAVKSVKGGNLKNSTLADIDLLLSLLIREWRPGELAGSGATSSAETAFSFRISQAERKDWVRRFQEKNGAELSPSERAQYRLLFRQGAWQEIFVPELGETAS